MSTIPTSQSKLLEPPDETGKTVMAREWYAALQQIVDELNETRALVNELITRPRL